MTTPSPLQRRGAAVPVIVLLVLAVTGMGMLAIRQGQQSVTQGIVATDAQRALEVADACAAGAMKALPMFLDVYLMMMRQSAIAENMGSGEGTGASIDWDAPPIFHEQFDPNYFGDDPFGNSPRSADCVVTIDEIADDAPAPGYSEGGGCFKRITLRVTASLSRTHAGNVASSDIMQNQSETVREVIVRGLFGPVSCN